MVLTLDPLSWSTADTLLVMPYGASQSQASDGFEGPELCMALWHILRGSLPNVGWDSCPILYRSLPTQNWTACERWCTLVRTRSPESVVRIILLNCASTPLSPVNFSLMPAAMMLIITCYGLSCWHLVARTDIYSISFLNPFPSTVLIGSSSSAIIYNWGGWSYQHGHDRSMKYKMSTSFECHALPMWSGVSHSHDVP